MDLPEDHHNLSQFDEMLGIVATRRPLLFDLRIDGPDFKHYFRVESKSVAGPTFEGVAGPTSETLRLWITATLWIP